MMNVKRKVEGKSMAIEIERKYLVHVGDFLNEFIRSLKQTRIEQGYLASGNGKAVRVRIEDNAIAVLCIKIKSNNIGSHEFEYDIPLVDGRYMLEVGCMYSSLSKVRYDFGQGLTVDRFSGPLAGLYIAEKEFGSAEEADAYIPPAWCMKEVTNMDDYYNCNLVGMRYDMKSGILEPRDLFEGK